MEENKKYYSVTTKCGHVGKTRFVKISFPIIAESKEEAAKIGRAMPRVKHDHKYAILDVDEISFEEYKALEEKNRKNPYLSCKNKQEQNKLCQDLQTEPEEVTSYRVDKKKRKSKIRYKQKLRKIIDKDTDHKIKNF